MCFKDEKLLLKVGNYKFRDGSYFVAQEVQYHHRCKRESICFKRKKTLQKNNFTEENAIYSYLNLLNQK